MKKLKIVILTLAALGVSFFTPATYAKKSEESTSSRGGYEITKYNVDIVVNENNTFDVSEDIDVNFSELRHGIYRKIPVYNTIERNDGTKSKNRAKITNIKSSERSSESREGDYLVLKLGDPDKEIIGAKTYHISYRYDIGRDPLKDADEFYFNIIGTEWDARISNVSFKITMPKEFDESKLGFSTGKKSAIGTTLVNRYVVGNEITGKLYGSLDPNQALTVRLELPEGYFVGIGSEPSSDLFILYAIPVIFFVISFYFWFKYGKDKKIFINPEYSAPKGCNSLDVAFFHKGKTDSTDVLSLIVYLANKGYLKIEEIKEKDGILSKEKSGFKFIKVKEYDGKDKNEKLFLEGLFKSGNEVTKKDLYDKFYKTTNEIIKNRNKGEYRREIFEKTSFKQAFAYITGAISLIFALAPAMLEYNESDTLLVAIVFPFYLFLSAIMVAFGDVSLSRSGKKGIVAYIISAILFVIGLVIVAIVAWPVISLHYIYITGFIIDFALFVGIYILAAVMPKRTEYGLEMYAKTEGFRQFLDAVEKDRIEKMVEENPNVFYDILPFTYVFGISEKWMKKFEGINLQAPDWYSGTTAFSVSSFGSFMNSTMVAATSSMSSSSGGGSAGGGSGGGGGGSW